MEPNHDDQLDMADNELCAKMHHVIDISHDCNKGDTEKKTLHKVTEETVALVDKSVMLREHGDNICDESKTVDSDDINLTDLPSEVLIHIASFLDSRTIIQMLYPVCKLFYALFSADRYWKTRISYRWIKSSPVFERDDFKWHQYCMDREEMHEMWSSPQDTYHHFMLKEGFFAAVDVVHLMQGGRYLAVGSRDRHLNIFDLSKHDSDTEHPTKNLNVLSESKMHKGWVWSMASHDNTLVTGSWDTFIRLWDFGDGNIQPRSHIKLKTAILGLYYEPNFIAAGGFDQRLYLVDPRAPEDRTRKHYHQKPILCVAGDSKFVITGGEDKLISVYDRVAGKNYKKIETESFVNSISYGNGQLWTGDREGRIHVLDTHNGLFDESTMQTFDVGHTGRVTGIIHKGGATFTCSSDSLMRVIEPTRDPDVINTLHSHSGEVARIAYNSGVLASAGADISVGVWLPKNHRKF